MAPAADPAGPVPRGWSRRIGAFAASGVLGIGLGVVAVRLPSWVPTHPVGASHSPRPSATASIDLEASTSVPVPMFAPFYQTWAPGSMAAAAQQAGVKNLILAFIVTPKKGQCEVYWNGDPRTPIAASLFGKDIAAIRARGGDVIASFGGGVWGTVKTELASACTDVAAIATAYENVITTYNLTRIDFNIEGDPLWDKDGVDRRNKALKLVQDWAVRQHRALQVSYTLAAALQGLPETAMFLLRNALSNGVRVDLVNLMPFDYCDKQRHSMITAVKDGVTGVHDQLVDLYPKRSPAELWHMIGVTVMPGIDDCGEGETFTLTNAEKMVSWTADAGVSLLSFWALQRDNGGCPGAKSSSGACSGLAQSTWQFTQIFAPFPALRRGA